MNASKYIFLLNVKISNKKSYALWAISNCGIIDYVIFT